MSDCDHSVIKCMKCHRYVGIDEQVIPVNPAVQRILDLEEEVLVLKAQLSMYKVTNVREAYSGKGGMQHEFA